MKRFMLIAAFVLVSFSVARADQITGFFSVTGQDSFTAPAPIGSLAFVPGSSNVEGLVGGAFATYLTDGNAVLFHAGILSYVQGMNTPIAFQAFSTTEGGETFGFTATSFDADFFTGTASTPGCLTGDTCLSVTGFGTFTGTGVHAFDPTPGQFEFTSQYVNDQSPGTITTFSASTEANPTPEPASIALFGTGLIFVALSAAGRKALTF